MPDATLLDQVKDFANRANPYPVYAKLRQTPVSRQDDGTDDGTWVAATHGTIASCCRTRGSAPTPCRRPTGPAPATRSPT
jgi:hypothetical protein